MLTNFIGLLELVEELSNDIHLMIQTVDQVQVPYCYEYIRLEYQVTFNKLKRNMEELEHAMLYFPQEVDNFVAYIQNEQPSANDHDEIFEMLDKTYQYYCDRYDVLKISFNENKDLAAQCYDATRQLPRPCCGA
jgi:hypothetical protein